MAEVIARGARVGERHGAITITALELFESSIVERSAHTRQHKEFSVAHLAANIYAYGSYIIVYVMRLEAPHATSGSKTYAAYGCVVFAVEAASGSEGSEVSADICTRSGEGGEIERIGRVSISSDSSLGTLRAVEKTWHETGAKCWESSRALKRGWSDSRIEDGHVVLAAHRQNEPTKRSFGMRECITMHFDSSLWGAIPIGMAVRAAASSSGGGKGSSDEDKVRVFERLVRLALSDRRVDEEKWVVDPLGVDPGVLGHVLSLIPWCVGFRDDPGDLNVWFSMLSYPSLAVACGDCEDMSVTVVRLLRVLQSLGDVTSSPLVDTLVDLSCNYSAYVVHGFAGTDTDAVIDAYKKHDITEQPEISVASGGGGGGDTPSVISMHMYVLLLSPDESVTPLMVDCTCGLESNPRRWVARDTQRYRCVSEFEKYASVFEKYSTTCPTVYPISRAMGDTFYRQISTLHSATGNAPGASYIVGDRATNTVGLLTSGDDDGGGESFVNAMRRRLVTDRIAECDCEKAHPAECAAVCAQLSTGDVRGWDRGRLPAKFADSVVPEDGVVMYMRHADQVANDIVGRIENFATGGAAGCHFKCVLRQSFVLVDDLEICRCVFVCETHKTTTTKK